MRETWKPVRRYKGWYEVSNNGNVRRVRGGDRNTVAGRVLKLHRHTSGYLTVALSRRGAVERLYVHRLVIEAFAGRSKREVNHKNGDKHDNRPNNLEYVTRRKNVRHARDELGVQYGAPGETHPRAKLTEAAVREIRRRYAAGELQRVIAADFSVSDMTVSNVVRRKTWKHI